MKIAIIGSGIAAFGVVSKIIDLGIKGEVSIFDNHQITNFNEFNNINYISSLKIFLKMKNLIIVDTPKTQNTLINIFTS